MSNRSEKHTEVNRLDVSKKSKTGDVGVLEQIVYWDLGTSDVRAGTL